MTAPTVPETELPDEVPRSPECTMAHRRGQAEIHGWCRQAEDVPLPYSRLLLAEASCRCPCHIPAS